ncbi:hypothetical protein QJS04_geneDACA003691 [Acorus gramineus]|uniref:Peptide chain release factor domain-containing protein n=1 Tax=Acorus gramineus TaxID=55184 RepID=A0AAV9BLC8_ACOGR|nr:hypothetical protein QJS04_geneDACA003691 [Acorus gramineus]
MSRLLFFRGGLFLGVHRPSAEGGAPTVHHLLEVIATLTKIGVSLDTLKKIEDAVERAEAMTSTALELEEVKRIKQEEIFRGCNLWNDLSTSNESLVALADTIKVVDSLKDLQYKAEEAKLITQLVERDAINHQLFKQAYNSAVDVSKFLDHYEMSKLLRGAFDIQGACMIITAGAESGYSEKWAEKVLGMYTRWAEKQGYSMRVLELLPSRRAGIKSATIEFESEYVYGHLLGEKGLHRMIRYCLDGSIVREVPTACLLKYLAAPDLDVTDEDLEVSSISSLREDQSGCSTETGVIINHLPTGIAVRCSGERSHFANKTKALNRLKAKLLVAGMEQGISDIRDIKRAAITSAEKQEVRNSCKMEGLVGRSSRIV